MLSRIFALVGLLGLAACAQVDTGLVDYRRAQTLSADQETAYRLAFLEECQFWSENNERRKKPLRNRGGKTVNPAKEESRSDSESQDGLSKGNPESERRLTICDPMLPARLFDKFVTNAPEYIKTNDVYSMRLDYGVIAEMSELPKLSRRGFKINGEIAVLVNAFEFSDKSGGARFFDLQQGNSTATDKLKKIDEFADAKVVYFNPDVDKGQALNFSNIPIVGPIKYGGRPIGVQIVVVELDRMSESTRSMVKKLADLGEAYVNPSSPITETLLELGKSLLEGSQKDDVIFEYRMVMDNGSYLGRQQVAAFQAGRLVFRRAQNRTNNFIWRNTVVDHNTGALYIADGGEIQQSVAAAVQDYSETQESFQKKPKKAEISLLPERLKRPKFTPFQDETYFTVNIINHGPDGPIGIYEHKTWSETSAAFDSYLDATQSTSAEKASEELDKLINTKASLEQSEQIGQKIDGVLARWRSYGLAWVRQLEEGKTLRSRVASLSDWSVLGASAQRRCELSYQDLLAGKARAYLARGEAVTATAELFSQLEKGRKSATKQPILRDEEFDLAIRRLWRGIVERLEFSVATQKAREEEFQSGSAFEKVYLKEGGKEQLSILLDSAAQNLEPKNCATVIARNPY